MSDDIQTPEPDVTTPPCDCFAQGKRNEGNQHPAFLAKLQNPVILRYVQTRPTQTYRGAVTEYVYKAGGRIKHLCVDGRDVPELLKQTFGKRPLFRIWKPVRMVKQTVSTANPKAAGLVSMGLPQNVNLPIPNGDNTPPVVVVDEQDLVDTFMSFHGIGETTARKLVGAGYTPEQLAEIAIDDTESIQSISAKAELSPNLVTRAIEEAITWAVDANKVQ